jgi:hypothetical protein
LSPSIKPLPSTPTEYLTFLQVKEEEIPVAKAFSSGPNSEGQKKIALIGPMEGGGGGYRGLEMPPYKVLGESELTEREEWFWPLTKF